MKFFVLALLMITSAHGSRQSVSLPCPRSLASSGEAVIRNLEKSLTLVNPGLRPDCGRDSEVDFLVVGESWDSDPTVRWTRAFAVCLQDGGEATWSRIYYSRTWPTTLDGAEVPGHRRRIPKRLAEPRGIRVAGGAFPSNAIRDLRSWLDLVGFWDLPSEFPADDERFHHLGVRVVQIRPDDGDKKMVVGGEFCSPLPRAVNLLFELLIAAEDPVPYLESNRDRIRQRLEVLRELPTRQ